MATAMKVLLAYDGSVCSDTAVAELPHAGFPPNTDIHILSLADVFLPPTTAPLPQVPVAVRHAWEQAEQAVEQARHLAQQARLRVQTLCPTWEVQDLA